jgi:predicted aldo/keto reductase-like oxidoreductase
MKMAVAEKDLPILIINKPQQGGKLVEVKPEEVVDIKVVSRPFTIPEGEEFPAVICPPHTDTPQ